MMRNDGVFVVAEMSGNHNGSLERALRIVDAAAEAGVDALKLQTYTADTMTLDTRSGNFLIKDPSSLWCGRTLYELYCEAAMPWEWHEPILKRCRERGIIGFSTPFDVSSVDFLEKLGVPIYKIAAFENGDIPLLKRVAATGKPVILSVGLIGPEEIAEAVAVLEREGSGPVSLLKCTSVYPAPPEASNLLTIPDMQKRFPQCGIGLSDHTKGIGVALGAIALGAQIIEKHFTLSRRDGGVDSAFSAEPQEMAQLVVEGRRVAAARGTVCYALSEAEQKSLIFRRSVYICEDIPAGGFFTERNIRCIRPGDGLHPRYYEAVLGKRASRKLERGKPLLAEDVKGFRPLSDK